MSQENVEIVRQMWEAFLGDDPGSGLLMLDPEVVYEDTVLPDSAGETFHGPEGVVRAWTRWTEAWEEFTTEIEQIVEAGERLVSIHTVHLKGKHSGAFVTFRYAYLYAFRDGKVIYLRAYLNPADALEAAGLSE
jgi:ketosteroid isomerase-like protein